MIDNQAEKKLKEKKSANPETRKEKEPKSKAFKARKEPKTQNKVSVSEVKANARFVRISPTKVRLVINQLKGKTADEALNYLRFISKSAVKPVAKLVNSGIANAENNFQLSRNDLFIKKIIANDGPILKRWRPRAHGRSTMIAKRTSHIELILGVRPGAKPVASKAKATAESVKAKPTSAVKEEVKVVSPAEVKKEVPQTAGRGPEERGRSQKGFLNRIFNRKTG